MFVIKERRFGLIEPWMCAVWKGNASSLTIVKNEFGSSIELVEDNDLGIDQNLDRNQKSSDYAHDSPANMLQPFSDLDCVQTPLYPFVFRLLCVHTIASFETRIIFCKGILNLQREPLGFAGNWSIRNHRRHPCLPETNWKGFPWLHPARARP